MCRCSNVFINLPVFTNEEPVFLEGYCGGWIIKVLIYRYSARIKQVNLCATFSWKVAVTK